MTLPVLSVGGAGTISVVANIEPERTCALVGAALAGDYDRAREIHHELGPLTRQLFVETNPIPVKEAMQMRGHGSARMRPPLSRLSEQHRDRLRELLVELEDESIEPAELEADR
jgi:4-hydroxy-tetrahydrodipicolinate synthase